MPGYLLTDSYPLLMPLDAPGGMKFSLFPGYPSLKLRKTPIPLKVSGKGSREIDVFEMGSCSHIGALFSGATGSLRVRPRANR